MLNKISETWDPAKPLLQVIPRRTESRIWEKCLRTHKFMAALRTTA